MTEEVMEIVQDSGKGKTLSAALIKERELRVENALNRKTIKYSVDVVALNVESQRKMVLGWQWLVAGLVVLLITILGPLVSPLISSEALYSTLFYVLGGAATIGCFFMAWKATSIKQIFYSRNANVPLIELLAGKPARKEFSAFIAKLEESIAAVQQKMDLSIKNQLAGEMRMLRRLSEEGVLSAVDYKKAQADLLSMH